MEAKSGVEETKMVASSTPWGKSYASTGNVQKVVLHGTTTNVTSAQDAENRITALSSALALRKTKALTPYHPRAWEELLCRYNLLRKYPTLPHQIQFGFDVGIRTIHRTFIPDNSPSLYTHSDQYHSILDREFSTGRYVGPLSRAEVESILGPFQTSPLSLIPKPGKPGKFRAIHNFSYPYSTHTDIHSINYTIDSNIYPCTWGTFSTICFLVWNLPPGSQASVRDVAEAYRTIPVDPKQWPGLVVKLREDDEFAINTCNNFGLASAGGAHGHLGDAAADIFRASGIGPLSKWVDDHIFFRFPKEYLSEYNQRRRRWHSDIIANGGQLQHGSRLWYRGETLPNGKSAEFDEDAGPPFRAFPAPACNDLQGTLFTYYDKDIDNISKILGIPWESSKTVPFNHTVPYLGLLWDLQNRTVSLPEAKKEKYRDAITKWKEKTTQTLQEVEQLYGKLLHASLVIPPGRAYLTSLEAMLGIFHDRPFVPRTPPKSTASDLSWWFYKLSDPDITYEIPGPVKLIDRAAYSDASSGIGIAIVIGNHWRAWRLIPGWKSEGRDIGWAEAIGFELLVKTLLVSSSPGDQFKVFGDNRGVVEGWWKGRSKNKATNHVFRRIHDATAIHKCIIHSRYIPSKENPADHPSRGIYPPKHLLLPAITIPDEIKSFVIDYDQPRQPAEINASRNRTESHPLPKPAKDLIQRTAFETEDPQCQWDETLKLFAAAQNC